MRTIPSTPNTALRAAMRLCRTEPLRDDVRRATVNRLLASTVAVTHDGSLELEPDDTLPRGRPLPLGIWRDHDGGFQLVAYTDADAIDPGVPAAAIAGDDLLLLCANNDVGLRLNPDSRDAFTVAVDTARECAERVHLLRDRAGVRVFDQETLVTMRPAPQLDHELVDLFVAELVGRGACHAYVAEYALHDRVSDPDEFTQIVVVGDALGRADFDLREDARTVLAYLTGEVTDSVAYNSMPQVRHVVEPVLQRGAVPNVLEGIV